jgi:hypothetical protein
MGWLAPLRHQCAKLVFSENHQEREPSMSEITTTSSWAGLAKAQPDGQRRRRLIPASVSSQLASWSYVLASPIRSFAATNGCET